MKNYFLLIILIFSLKVTSQVAINDTGNAPNTHAMLDVDVSSNDKGVLIPRLTTSERTGMSLSATEEGLTVYDETTKSFWFWNGTQWSEINVSTVIDAWKTTGNAGTTSGTDFLGTTDNQALDIKTNNVLHVRLTTKGQIETLNTGKSVFIGEGAGDTDDGTDNELVAVGNQSLHSNTEGAGNTGVGHQALYYNTKGNFNTAVGNRALYSNTTGVNNTAIGYKALYFNKTGNFNTANGNSALYHNTSGHNNFAIGYKAMFFNTTGHENTAIGSVALYSNKTGHNNVAIGRETLYLNTIGNYNTANGRGSLYSNTEGHNNSAYGYKALYSSDNGKNNTAIGSVALYSNTSGNYNTAVGREAVRQNKTGSKNTSIGYQALYSNVNGEKNTAVGYYAFYSGTNFSNSTAIGHNTAITASNQVRVGDAAVTSIGGQVSWTSLSDARFKTDIRENVPGLSFVLKLRPVTYHLDMEAIARKLKTPDSLRLNESEKIKASMLQTGFLAQEVEQTAQSVGYDFSGIDKPKNKNDYYGLRYAEFVVPLVKAVQEQQNIIEQQRQQIKVLQQQNQAILKRLDALENR